MALINGNIIQKQIIDININTSVNEFEIQNDVENLCRLKLKSGLEKLMLKYDSFEDIVRIDLLFAEVEYNSLADFQNLFAEKILAEIEKQLNEKISHTETRLEDQSYSKADNLMRIFNFYIRHGFLPWWSSIKTSSDWQELLSRLFSEENKVSDWSVLYPSLKEKQVRTRLSVILNLQQFWKLIDYLSSADLTSLKADYEIIRENFSDVRQQHAFGLFFKELLLYTIVEGKQNRNLFDSFSDILVNSLETEYPEVISSEVILNKIRTPELKRLLVKKAKETRYNLFKLSVGNNTPDRRIIEKTKPADSGSEQISQKVNEEIYINNAGLIIVSAFLPVFFKDIKLLSKTGILDSNKAIAVLQYMVTGLDEYHEFEVVLPKILCGLEISDPVEGYKLSRKEKFKVNELLESIIEHWTVLKSTSTEGLRSAFFQREGKLTFENNNWYLKVRQESYDMLISHIPWNISLIKLPWMKSMLHAEWM